MLLNAVVLPSLTDSSSLVPTDLSVPASSLQCCGAGPTAAAHGREAEKG